MSFLSWWPAFPLPSRASGEMGSSYWGGVGEVLGRLRRMTARAAAARQHYVGQGAKDLPPHLPSPPPLTSPPLLPPTSTKPPTFTPTSLCSPPLPTKLPPHSRLSYGLLSPLSPPLTFPTPLKLSLPHTHSPTLTPLLLFLSSPVSLRSPLLSFQCFLNLQYVT